MGKVIDFVTRRVLCDGSKKVVFKGASEDTLQKIKDELCMMIDKGTDAGFDIEGGVLVAKKPSDDSFMFISLKGGVTKAQQIHLLEKAAQKLRGLPSE